MVLRKLKLFSTIKNDGDEQFKLQDPSITAKQERHNNIITHNKISAPPELQAHVFRGEVRAQHC